jgi:hypothetical protein
MYKQISKNNGNFSISINNKNKQYTSTLTSLLSSDCQCHGQQWAIIGIYASYTKVQRFKKINSV